MVEMLTGMLSEGHLGAFDQLPDLVARYAGAAGMEGTRESF